MIKQNIDAALYTSKEKTMSFSNKRTIVSIAAVLCAAMFASISACAETYSDADYDVRITVTSEGIIKDIVYVDKKGEPIPDQRKKTFSREELLKQTGAGILKLIETRSIWYGQFDKGNPRFTCGSSDGEQFPCSIR